jgi:hypothetical protein
MDVRRVGEWVAGSVAVYVIVVACSAEGGGSSKPSDAGLGGSAGSSFFDAFSDPVADAFADVNQSGSRLKAKYWAASDGSKQFLQKWRDTQLNVDCTFMMAADAKIRCLPAARDQLLYADDKCTQPLMNDIPADACSTKYMRASFTVLGTCTQETGTRLYEKGAAYTGTGSVYQKQSGACNYLSPVGNQLPLFIATEVPATTFVDATEAVEP